MDALPPGTPPAGVFLSLLTESFAVRALLGSLLAAAMAAAALRWEWVNTPRARRLVVLAPILAAGAAAVASVIEAETYLPQLWIASSGGVPGQALELLGELRVISTARGVDVLFLSWALIATMLVSRRAWGALLTRRLVRASQPILRSSGVQRTADAVASAMDAPAVAVRFLDRCPGGAFATGTRRAVVVIDPEFLDALDDQETEGLLAHEIAHVARRDSLLALGVGVFSDLTFFLPTVHLVDRWLRREREESADEWASVHTGRPAALASGILKVWERAAPRPAALQGCGAMPAVNPIAARMPLRRRRPRLSDAGRSVAARVERLVQAQPVRTAARQTLEISLAAVVITAASVVALVVPRWVANELGTYSVAFGYIPPPAQPVESPAFATFRSLAPIGDPAQLHGFERTFAPDPAAHERLSTCPCVESQAEWLAGVPAAVPEDSAAMAWRRTANPSWDVTPDPGSVKARPLLTLPEAGPQLGFFVVAETQP